MTGPYYVVMWVGCLECGNATEVHGIFTDHDEAVAAIEGLNRQRQRPLTLGPSDLEYDEGCEHKTCILDDGYRGSSLQLHQWPAPAPAPAPDAE